jgi:uncharacterized cupredoxin-like copper-binding protein
MKRIGLLALVALVLTGLAFGAFRWASAADEIQQIKITAKDFAYEGPQQVNSGLVTFTLVNDGKEPHHAHVARLNDGVTMDQLKEALQKNPDSALGMLTFAGGMNTIDPGMSQEVTLTLAAGDYVILCFVSGSDNVPHLAKGMMSPLRVVTVAPMPKFEALLDIKDFSFELPANIKAGKQVWKVINTGPQVHEFTLLRLKEGTSIDDFMKMMQSQTPPTGPMPFDNYGGFGAINSGLSGWVTLDLKPGNYVAICFVPDPASHKAHFERGMVKGFTVQ